MNAAQQYLAHHGTTIQGYPVYPKHSPNVFVRNILNNLKHKGFTGITTIGTSGSGKSTCVSLLMHLMHQQQNFAINRYDAIDLLTADKIIKTMPKAPTILFFEDATYATRDMKDSQVDNLAQGLTVIRHAVKNNVICILNIHYSKGIDKIFRNTDFKILTSISDEEMDNYQKLFGYKNKYKLMNFARRYRAMMLYDNFRVKVGAFDQTYITDQPFRVALVSDMGYLHSMVYYKDACTFCMKDYTAPVMDGRTFTDTLLSKYSKNLVRGCLRWFLYFNQNQPNALDSKQRSLFNTINTLWHQNKINPEEVLEILKTDLKNARQRGVQKAINTIHARQEGSLLAQAGFPLPDNGLAELTKDAP